MLNVLQNASALFCRIDCLIFLVNFFYLITSTKITNLGEKAMLLLEIQLREGKSSVINQVKFIRAVADNIKQRLFTTLSNRAQQSVDAIRTENYKTFVSQMDVLDPEKLNTKILVLEKMR